MKYKKSFNISLALLSLLVAAVAASPAQATSHPGYVYSTDGKTPVHDMDGHCVRTMEWRKEFATPECNPELLPPKVVAPAPAPVVVAPAPAPAPPMDTDGDGVPDYMDKCPDTPKGVMVDKDGCPADSDGDGVPDYMDKCPDTPKGVKVDKNGCPEKVSITLSIEFDSGKAAIKPQYDDQIKKVADFMKTYPEANAVIEGFTDNVGKEASNVRLSTKRAESVRTELIKKFGIPASRLTAKGFGSSQPVADNATPAGRQKNRRIEAVIETTATR
jgi:outer membrane protein OmpA-like peptidoglycan-associated protein